MAAAGVLSHGTGLQDWCGGNTGKFRGGRPGGLDFEEAALRG